MKITNEQDLPVEIVEAVTASIYEPSDDPKKISVTQLIDAPYIRHLRRKHWDTLTEDASERIWSLIGTAIHGVLDKHGSGDAEKYLKADVGQHTISGRMDRYCSDTKTIRDYKFTSVWAVVFGKAEWATQLNAYAWLLRKNGHEVHNAEIIAILRDWKKSEYAREKARENETGLPCSYPPRQVMRIKVKLWTNEEQDKYIADREAMFCGDLQTCSDEERWGKPDTWACKKKGQKRAVRVFKTEKEAVDMAKANGLEIEFRKGGYTRCDEFCPVKEFCVLYQGGNK